jgi:hypothetical protein
LVAACTLTLSLAAVSVPAQETTYVGLALAAKARLAPATPLEMAQRLEKEQAKGAGMLMPIPERQVRLSGGVIPLDVKTDGFPAEFLEGLVPDEVNGVEAWRATLRTDDASGDMLFYNADDKVFWSVTADAAVWSADWIARLHSPDRKAADFFSTEQVLLTLSEKTTRVKLPADALYRSAWLATRQYFLPSHVEMTFTFILQEDLDAYRSAGTATRSSAATFLPMSMSAPLTGLAVTGFTADTNGVALSAAWPTGTSIAGDALDIFFSRTLMPPAWTNQWRVAVDPAVCALDVTIPRSELPPAPEAPPAACVTNIVPSAYDPGVMVTNIVCTNAVWLTDSGFFRLADLADTDGDTLTDAFEKWVSKTNPLSKHSDNDGLNDGWEVKYGYDPLTDNDPYADPDEDGLPDFLEELNGTDPRTLDTDGDGFDDAWEAAGGLDPLVPTSHTADPDGDGLPNIVEYQYYLRPDEPDSDGDSLPDFLEVEHFGERVGTAPNIQTISPTITNTDPDRDGLGNTSELLLYGTDPFLADTDADGLPDGEEAAYADANDNDRKRVGFPSASSGFNWLGTVATNGAVNLLIQPGALYANTATDDGLVTAELPFPVRIGGLSVSNFAASVNGVAWLLAPGFSVPTGLFRQGVDLSETTVNAHHITVAPCWGDLTAQPYGSDTNATSSITVAGVTHGGVDFNVIEWRNMGFKGRTFPANRHTFQIIIPSVLYTNLYANALFTRGLTVYSSGSGPAYSATYGAQGPRAWQQHILCFNNVYPTYNFATAYILGTGTDPLDPDMDADGLKDGAEIAAGTDPFAADTDGDGMPDAWEVRYGFDPLVWNDPGANSDSDGLTNLQEALNGTNPFSEDTDGDGLNDDTEVAAGLSPTSRDTDCDGIEDADELLIGTNPLQPDSDGDTLPDGWEWKYGMDPTADNTADADPGNDPLADPDTDGLTNQQESDYGTDPYDEDTDNDGVSDGDEAAQGSDPLDPADHEPRDTQVVSFSYGDPSGSHSEKYRLTVTPVSGDPRPAQRRLNRDYGEVESVSLVLIKGAKYAVSLDHIGTDPAFMTEYGFSNYDWELDIGSSQGCLALDDPDQIVTTFIDWPNDTFLAAGKHATLALLKIETQTVATQPADRTRKTVGVGEEVNLKLLPEGLGLITWNIPSGSGYLSHYFSNASILFTAPGEASDTTVTASVSGGESEVEFDIIEPSGILMENKEPVAFHCATTWMSISYQANVYFQPDTVNFYRLYYYEGASAMYATGCYAYNNTGIPIHDRNGPHPMSQSVVAGKGTLCADPDNLTSAIDIMGPTDVGDRYWELDWSYTCDNMVSPKVIETIRQNSHFQYVDGEPMFTLTKDNSGFWITPSATEMHPVTP